MKIMAVESILENGEEYEPYCELCGVDATPERTEIKTVEINEYTEIRMCDSCRRELYLLLKIDQEGKELNGEVQNKVRSIKSKTMFSL